MRTLIVALMIVVGFALPLSAQSGLTHTKSSHDVKNTADRLETVLKEKGMTIAGVKKKMSENPDDVRKTHPSLVPWSELSEEEKDKDRNPVRGLPEFLSKTRFQIYRPQ